MIATARIARMSESAREYSSASYLQSLFVKLGLVVRKIIGGGGANNMGTYE